MDRKQLKEISTYVLTLSGMFYSSSSGHYVYTERMQQIARQCLEKLGELTGSFDSQVRNERENITAELTATDRQTGEKIPLIDMVRMDDSVRGKSPKAQSMFTVFKALALSNKIAHRLFDESESLDQRVENMQGLSDSMPDPPDGKTLEFGDVTGLSDYDFEKLMKTLNGNGRITRGKTIPICKQLGISIEGLVTDEDFKEKFREIKACRKQILEKRLDDLKKLRADLAEQRQLMFWVKTQYTSMVGQLIALDPAYKDIDYEIIDNGDPGFRSMLVVDAPELAYLIEVHMPDYLTDELQTVYGLKPSITKEHRKSIPLGATAIYDRDEEEVKRIRNEADPSRRKEVLGRPMPSEIAASAGSSGGHGGSGGGPGGGSPIRVQLSGVTEESSLLERFFASRKMQDFLHVLSVIRSEEGNKHTEEIAVTEAIRMLEAEASAGNIRIKDVVDYALKTLKAGDRFDKIYYMSIYQLPPEEIVKKAAYYGIIRKQYLNEEEVDIVKEINFIERKTQEIDSFAKDIDEEEIYSYDKYKNNKKKLNESIVRFVVKNRLKKRDIKSIIDDDIKDSRKPKPKGKSDDDGGEVR